MTRWPSAPESVAHAGRAGEEVQDRRGGRGQIADDLGDEGGGGCGLEPMYLIIRDLGGVQKSTTAAQTALVR